MKKIYTFILLAGGIWTANAQDIHFSQYLNSPLNLNPAMTGNMNADIRMIANYRNQWKSVSADPYKTISASVDGTLPPKKRTNDFWGVGLVFNNDNAGASNLKMQQALLSLSYSKTLNPKISSVVTLGFQGGLAQRSIDPNNLTWDNQYDGVRYDPTLPSGESFTGIALMYPDMSFGGLWNVQPKSNMRLQVGSALYHFNRPSISLSRVAKDPLNMRFTFHAVSQIFVPKRPGSSFIPSVVFFQQGPERLINVGGAWRVRLKEESRYTGWVSEIAAQAGVYYRVKDAAFINVRLDFADFAVGTNYDFNVSTLQVASNSRGGMEFFLMYQKGLLGKAKYNPKSGMKFVQY